MTTKHLFFVLAACSMISCSSSKETKGLWVNQEKIKGKSFTNIFIIVMTADAPARVKLEKDLYAVAVARGYKAVKSIDVMPPSLSDPKVPTKEEIVSKVKESGCDGVFVAALLRQEEDISYTPGVSAVAVSPNATWNGSYLGYYSHWYPTVSAPGYYAKEKNYYMQSNLYDAATEEIMWKIQSDIFDPSNIEGFSRAYTSNIVKQLEKIKLLKK